MIEENDEWLEFFRSSNTLDVKAYCDCLREAGIETSEGIAGSSNGLGEFYNPRDNDPNEVIIKVRRRDFERARSALEDDLALSSLPDDHYLHDFSDKELIELLVDQESWSAYDVAHAKRLARDRQLDLDQVKKEIQVLEEKKREGKSATKGLLALGWATVFAGGLIGVGIGWSLAYMEEKTPSGNYPTYNEQTRETGKKMLSWGIFMMVAWYHYEFFLKVFNLV